MADVLVPLTRFPSTSWTTLAIINPLLQNVVKKIDEGFDLTKLENPVVALFLHIFLLWLDSIEAIFNGGEQDWEKYTWLIRSAVLAKVTPEVIDSWTKDVRNGDPKTVLAGSSFNLSKEHSDRVCVSEFITCLAKDESDKTVDALMNTL